MMGQRLIGWCLRHDPARGVQGHAPPENFSNLHSRKYVSRGFFLEGGGN